MLYFGILALAVHLACIYVFSPWHHLGPQGDTFLSSFAYIPRYAGAYKHGTTQKTLHVSYISVYIYIYIHRSIYIYYRHVGKYIYIDIHMHRRMCICIYI